MNNSEKFCLKWNDFEANIRNSFFKCMKTDASMMKMDMREGLGQLSRNSRKVGGLFGFVGLRIWGC